MEHLYYIFLWKTLSNNSDYLIPLKIPLQTEHPYDLTINELVTHCGHFLAVHLTWHLAGTLLEAAVPSAVEWVRWTSPHIV